MVTAVQALFKESLLSRLLLMWKGHRSLYVVDEDKCLKRTEMKKEQLKQTRNGGTFYTPVLGK